MLETIKWWIEIILAIVSLLTLVIAIIRYIFITKRKEVSSSLQVLDMPDEIFEESFPYPSHKIYYPKNEEFNSNEKTAFYTKDKIIRNFKIIEMNNKFKNGKWNIKKGKTIKKIDELKPDKYIEVFYERPECSPPKIKAEWQDDCFRKAEYNFHYNGFNGCQSRSQIVYKGTFRTFLGKLFGIF